jgi:hypothetical protein
VETNHAGKTPDEVLLCNIILKIENVNFLDDLRVLFRRFHGMSRVWTQKQRKFQVDKFKRFTVKQRTGNELNGHQFCILSCWVHAASV